VSDDVRACKDQLRAIVLASRAQLSATQRTRAGVAIAEHGRAQWAGIATVAAYLSLDSEPPTLPLLDVLLASGTQVLLPIIDGHTLDWAPYSVGAHVVAGPLGISQPTTPRLGAAALVAADVVLVPALAVDRAGNRLGRGRGYYDRALAGITAPITAVIYDDELLDDVPAEAHDRRVDAVVRPSGLTSSS